MKICGNRRPEDILAARDADAVGVVVAAPRSLRNVSLSEAEALLALARPRQARVAVTVASDRDTLAVLGRIADHVQCPAASAGAVEALRAAGARTRFILSARPEQWTQAAAAADFVLLDALGPGGYGGSGTRVDEAAARDVVAASPRPVLLAGGLTPANVAGAIRAVRPFGVDVSSGVEIDGVKDADLVRRFIAEAKAAPAPAAGGIL